MVKPCPQSHRPQSNLIQRPNYMGTGSDTNILYRLYLIINLSLPSAPTPKCRYPIYIDIRDGGSCQSKGGFSGSSQTLLSQVTWQRPRPDVGVGPVECASVAAAAALPANVDVVKAEASGHELDAGVGLDLVHGLGDGQPVVLVQVVTQHIGNLAKFAKHMNQVL